MTVCVFEQDDVRWMMLNQVAMESESIRLIRVESAEEALAVFPSAALLNPGRRDWCPLLLASRLREAGVPVLYCDPYAKGASIWGPNTFQVRTVSCSGLLEAIEATINEAITSVGDRPETSSSIGYDELLHVARLSPVELDIFCMFGRSSSVGFIAEHVGRSKKTVETHVRNIRGKLRIGGMEAFRDYAYHFSKKVPCHTFRLRDGHVCSFRKETVGSCPMAQNGWILK